MLATSARAYKIKLNILDAQSGVNETIMQDWHRIGLA